MLPTGFAVWCRMVRAQTFPGFISTTFGPASRHLSSLLIPFSCWYVHTFSDDVGTSPT